MSQVRALLGVFNKLPAIFEYELSSSAVRLRGFESRHTYQGCVSKWLKEDFKPKLVVTIPYGLMVVIRDFQSRGRGSIPRREVFFYNRNKTIYIELVYIYSLYIDQYKIELITYIVLYVISTSPNNQI